VSAIEFLDVDDILGIHALQVARFGGALGLRAASLRSLAAAG
jgi:hypothetical protein